MDFLLDHAGSLSSLIVAIGALLTFFMSINTRLNKVEHLTETLEKDLGDLKQDTKDTEVELKSTLTRIEQKLDSFIKLFVKPE